MNEEPALAKALGRSKGFDKLRSAVALIGDEKTKEKDDNLAAVKLAADLLKLKKEARWRPYHNYCTRLTLAWFFAYAIYYTCLLMAFTYGVKFGNTETKTMVLSWAVAISQNYCIIEPLQIALAAGAPCLFDESHALGRCCLWVRYIYNELFSP